MLYFSYHTFQVVSTDWHRWSAQQREAHLKKIRKAAVETPYNQSDVVSSTRTQELMSAHQPHMKPVCALAVSVGEVQITGIPEATVEGIWLKTAALISNSKSDAIVSAPGSTNSIMACGK